MSFIPFHHAGDDESGHSQKPLYVGVYHCAPIFRVAFILFVKAESEAGVIDEDIDFLPFRFE